ncbi:MAG: tetratricopeptide repeat protein [Rickettsia endosymbiont of Argas persicus]
MIIVVIALGFCGYMFLSRKKPEPAVNDLEKELVECEEAIKKNPNDYKVYYNKGVLLEDLGEYETAIELYNKALELKASSS